MKIKLFLEDYGKKFIIKDYITNLDQLIRLIDDKYIVNFPDI